MLRLSNPQGIFLNGLNTKFRAYVGGFGSGKTFVGCLDLLVFAGKYPGTVQGYFGASYPSIRDIFYPTFEEAAGLMGFRVEIKESNKEVHIYRGPKYYGTVICRSMDRPDSIVGFKISRALVDELDVLTTDKADKAWKKIIARMRLVIDGVQNSIGVTTTPEGFKFVYRQFALNPTESYSMVQASSYENAKFLPPDYIESMLETYPKELCNAYIGGQFVNLTSGTVYKSYNRVVCRSSESVNGNERLYIGMDFNITKMAATVYVKRGAVFHAVDEFCNVYHTPEMIRAIRNRYEHNSVFCYPDASGSRRDTRDSSGSDHALLEEAGFILNVDASNPAVRDRINAVNAAFENAMLFVNDINCPETARCLEQQSYDVTGNPDKKSGNDHQNDATGYPIAYELPIIRPITKVGYRWAN